MRIVSSPIRITKNPRFYTPVLLVTSVYLLLHNFSKRLADYL